MHGEEYSPQAGWRGHPTMRSLQSQAEKGAGVTEFTFCANTARGTLQAYLGGRGGLVVCLMLVIPRTQPSGSSVHGISPARILEWAVVSSSRLILNLVKPHQKWQHSRVPSAFPQHPD